jgi:DNA-binding MarR family transcriptional regulator
LTAELQHSANLLGALSLAVTDRSLEAIAEKDELSETAAAALSALDQFLDRPSVERLGQVVGVTSSGAVRLVNRLESAGYVQREPGRDARVRQVRLTARGRRAARRVAGARAGVLEGALRDLSDEERELLDGLLARALVRMMRAPGATKWICRLCDTGACGRAAGNCPVANEALRRWGGADDRRTEMRRLSRRSDGRADAL